MRRKILLPFLLMLFSTAIFAQNQIVKEHYTVSGGILGAGNYSKFRVDNEAGYKSEDWKFGFAGGFWLNLPLSKVVSLEPQFQYSEVAGLIERPSPSIALDQKLDYLSIPVLLKFSGKVVGLFVGPQFDILLSAKNDKNGVSNMEAFKSSDIALTGGLELFPHGRISVYGRYIYGLQNINDLSGPDYMNSGIQAGLKLKLFGKFIPADSDGDGIPDPKDQCPNVAGLERYQGCPIPDTDGDGINDEEDKCPKETGVAKYGGCPIPDTDKDGLNDDEDKCPTVAGTAKYGGCPIPDKDGDGINDEEDKCPDVAGLARYGGCPIPDTDGDGINDEDDRCPKKPGVPEMKGCPRINYTAHAVTFATSSSKLSKAGMNELDHVVTLLQDNPDIKIKLDGYTDASGSDKINNPLSEQRAEAAKAYIVSKGVDESRIATEGHGSANPVADNKTKAGKAENRRIELTIQ